jgi:probable phosphoglycerate mutase
MKVYITRHGTTEWNIKRILQGWGDSNLTEDGIMRAIKLGEKLQNVKFDMIYSSPQNRALETAKLIRGNRNIKIETTVNIRELGFGIWEGMCIDDIANKYPEEFSIYNNDPVRFVPMKGESYEELFKRINIFIDEIKSKKYENILVVTHGVTIKALIANIKGLPLEEFSKLPVYTGTALNIVELKEDKMEFIVENDVSHLDIQEFDLYRW